MNKDAVHGTTEQFQQYKSKFDLEDKPKLSIDGIEFQDEYFDEKELRGEKNEDK